MAFKQRNNPFKKNSPLKSNGPKTVKVFGGRGVLDVSTEAGRKILEEINSIKTVKPGELGKSSRSISSKVKNILSKGTSKGLLTTTARASAILNMFVPTSAGKGSTTLDKDRYDLMKNIED